MKQPNTASAGKRLSIAVVVGVVVALLIATLGSATFAPLGGWDATAIVYLIWTAATVWNMGSAETKSHAKWEDPSRPAGEAIILSASIISLVAIGFLLAEVGSSHGVTKGLEIALSLISVIVSWAMVHVNYTLHYARLYYSDPEGGVNFNEPPAPQYKDFAYLAFTLGMTFQVSDTDLKTTAFRVAVLKHTLLSYLFGTIIIATTINAVASLVQ